MKDDFARQTRKARVFPIMYGTYLGATQDEMREWRKMCAEYINGKREYADTPLTLTEFRIKHEAQA